MARTGRWMLYDAEDGTDLEMVGRSELREWLTDGTLLRAEARRILRLGVSEAGVVLSQTGGAFPLYGVRRVVR